MSSPSTTASPLNNRSRVKLYTLNEERQWDDRGTGFVTCSSPSPPNVNHSIVVKSEADGSTLLDSKIQLNTKYQKQQVRSTNNDRPNVLNHVLLGNVNRLVRRRKIRSGAQLPREGWLRRHLGEYLRRKRCDLLQ
jgi:hypothetical protein